MPEQPSDKSKKSEKPEKPESVIEAEEIHVPDNAKPGVPPGKPASEN